MGVTVTPSNGANYTWAGTTWAWDDPKSTVTWATSYQVTSDMQVTETVATAEQLGNATTKPIGESFATAEGHVKNFNLRPNEAFTTAEGLSRTIQQALAEAFAAAESRSSLYGQALAESFATSDALKHTFQKALAETLATLESINNIIAGAMLNLPFGESLLITEGGVANSLTKSIQETIAAAEAFARVANYSLSIPESVAFGEALAKTYSKPVSETVALAESLGKGYSLPLSESIAVAEGFARVVQFYQVIAEAFGLGEVADGINTPPNLEVNEPVTIQETLSHAVTKLSSETLSFAELLSKESSKYVNETITFVDAEKKTHTLKVSEAFSLVENYIRKANAVFSNMIANTGDLTQQSFEGMIEKGRVIGYENFREFIPGDYTYQKALFRVVLDSVNSDRARLSQMKVNIDVPDIFDRGTVTITAGQAAAGVAVTFARQFHVVPEITMTLKSGGVIAIPVIVSPTVSGFTAILKDPATNNGVAGTLTWAAHGY